MLVNDRKEIRYLGMPPQFQALRIQIKQLYRVVNSQKDILLKESMKELKILRKIYENN